ncbi:MAG: serine protein kinase [Planctomycetota bacterium]|nr:serine protein kinase [Planctomycetota bacterium]
MKDFRDEGPVRTPRELSGNNNSGESRSSSPYLDWVGEGSADVWEDLHWEGALSDYLELVRNDPRLARNAFQRLYDMIVESGVDAPEETSQGHPHYRFFEDAFDGGRDAIFGLEAPLADLVSFFRAAAHGLGAERRVLLLHGPVGSSKSTIARLLKRGLQQISARPEGALFSYRWLVDGEWHDCPMHEDPLHLLPSEVQKQVVDDLNSRFDGEYNLVSTGRLCPFCRHWREKLLKESGGSFSAIEDAIQVYRIIFSEQDRVGIGTFQPKDEKNQDSTELTGDINYRNIACYGSDSDPRAFNFDGEFHVANRGLIEFVELLKLDTAFLYDLLGATQEHTIKPKKFAQTDIDEVILGHTNSPEFRRLQNNELMEAFRDRMCRIDVPYNTRLADEVRIYKKSFENGTCAGRHLAPHALDAAAMWAVLTRIDEPKNVGLTVIKKMRLYDGHDVQGFSMAVVDELRKESPRDGMFGISPRYVQDRIAAALVQNDAAPCLTAFDVLDSLEGGLEDHSLIDSDEERGRVRELLDLVREELEETAKEEVRRAVSADKDAVQRLCCNYIDSVSASVEGADVSDERLMRSIEEKIGVTEARKSDFRREILNYIDVLSSKSQRFTYASNARLQAALELKLFEDCRDSFKITSVVASTVVDRDVETKVDVVASRLVQGQGYCEQCASRTLDYVGGIFARGDVHKSEDEDSSE